MDDVERTEERRAAEEAIRRLARDNADTLPPPPKQCQCAECGTELPDVRQDYGFKLCLGCQTEQERLAAQYKRGRAW